MTTAIAPQPSEQASANARRAVALDAFLATFYRLRPVTATFCGVHAHDHELPDFSPEGLLASHRVMGGLRRTLADAGLGVLHSDELQQRDWLSIDGALADAILEVQLAEDDSGHFQRGNPSIAVGEALFSVIALAAADTAPIAPRVEAAIARLRAFPAFLHGAVRSLGEGALPGAWRDRAVRECDGGVLLLADLAGWPVAAGAPVALCRELQAAAAHASAALDWFRSNVAGREASTRYAAGHGLLALLVRRGHWVDVSIERLRHEARAALERETHHLHDALQGEAWAVVSGRLAAHHPDTGRVLEAARTAWRECRELSRGEVEWPPIDLPYREAPDWARRAAPYLYYLPYRSPAPIGEPSVGHYDVLLPPPADAEAEQLFARSWNHAAIRLNHVAHHGGLGHHVQNWHAARSPSRIGRVAAVDGACRIAMFAGGTMAEGWAVYATEIMEGLGSLTPDERIAEHHMRVRLMTRAVVDLELHTGRMSFDDAVRFHGEAYGATPSAALGEVTKCSMFPGTAMMYWLGVREVWRIRTAEEAVRGAAFDARAFHDELLSFGSIPVALAGRLLAATRPAATGHRPPGTATA